MKIGQGVVELLNNCNKATDLVKVIQMCGDLSERNCKKCNIVTKHVDKGHIILNEDTQFILC